MINNYKGVKLFDYCLSTHRRVFNAYLVCYILFKFGFYIEKGKHEEKTTVNTFWLTISFTLIMWSIAILAAAGK